MPTLTMSFFVNCGGNKPAPTPKTYSASVVSIGEETVNLSNTNIDTTKDYETKIFFSDETYHNMRLPSHLYVTVNNEPVAFNYTIDEFNKNEGTLIIDKLLLKGDIKVILQLEKKTNWYEFSDWWNYCSDSKDGIITATKDDIGIERLVKINGLMHKVRLIGLDHNNPLFSNLAAHCTFEFSNVITNSDGTPYTTIYNEVENTNYPESDLHILLNGDSEEKTGIIELFPEGLKDKIQTVHKYVATALMSNEFTRDDFDTKLFPLAHSEVASSEEYAMNEGEKYDYYEKSSMTRIKETAGNNPSAQDYWLRSPYIEGTSEAWKVEENGKLFYSSVNSARLAIAPAFCI